MFVMRGSLRLGGLATPQHGWDPAYFHQPRGV